MGQRSRPPRDDLIMWQDAALPPRRSNRASALMPVLGVELCRSLAG